MNNFLSLMINMSFTYLLFFICNYTCTLNKTCLCLCLCLQIDAHNVPNAVFYLLISYDYINCCRLIAVDNLQQLFFNQLKSALITNHRLCSRLRDHEYIIKFQFVRYLQNTEVFLIDLMLDINNNHADWLQPQCNINHVSKTNIKTQPSKYFVISRLMTQKFLRYWQVRIITGITWQVSIHG